MTLHTTGTVSISNGSTSLTGSGTSWIAALIKAGDDVHLAGMVATIASVNSATSITLLRPWPGSSQSGANYGIRLVDDASRSLTANTQLLGALSGGTLTSLGEIAGAADYMPYWTGAGVMASTALTSAARSLLDDASVAAMRTTLELVKQSSATDATAGRVLLTGAFGLGEATNCPTAADLNDATMVAGLYRITTGTANRPFDLGTVIVLRNGTARITQMAHRLVSGASSDVLSIRHHHDGTWSAWRTIFHSGNAVGTVSQSSGVPTGALIERGSNANGEYSRLADGTQICWCLAAATQTADQATGNGFRASADVSFTYPAAFSATPHVMPAGRYSSGAASWTVPAAGGSTTGTVARLYAFVSGAVGTPGIVAINRWF